MSVRATTRRLGDLAGAMRHHRRRVGVGTSRDELLDLQRRRLVEMARHAAAASPLYRELYAGVELADDLDVRSLPVVTKDMLMARFDDWVTDPRLHLPEVAAHMEQLHADDLYLGEYRCVVTGGTSGHKGVFVYGRDEWRQLLGMLLRYSDLEGRTARPGRRLRAAVVTVTPPMHGSGRLAMSFSPRMLLRLDARAPLPEIVGALNDNRPEYLVGYASMLSLLAVEQQEGRLRIAPRTVATTGEVRTDEMAANIRAAWGVEPFNRYANSEGLFGCDCEHHQGIHLFEDLALVEVVDEGGDPVPDGVLGAKLLLTSFIKRAQPLLRYEISDMVALTGAPCACGRPFARIVSVEGRSDDILYFQGAGGQRVTVHPLALHSPMAGLAELRQFKLVHDDQGLHAFVALRDGVDVGEATQRVEATLRTKLLAVGAEPRLDVVVIDEIPAGPGPGGKFKIIESRVSSAAATPAPTN